MASIESPFEGQFMFWVVAKLEYWLGVLAAPLFYNGYILYLYLHIGGISTYILKYYYTKIGLSKLLHECVARFDTITASLAGYT